MSSSLFSNATASADATELEAIVARLRAEHDATESEAQRGVLLHEIATLEALQQDDAQAARDFLSAVNSRPDFREPLEQLITLMERRKSAKNLSKLAERLAKIAETKEESARALLSIAELRQDIEGNLEEARSALLEAVEAKPDDVDSWLALEHLSSALGDAELRLRALSERAAAAEDPTWKALLLVDVARARQASGDTDSAVSALEQALATRSAAEYAVLTELERLGEATQRPELVLRACLGHAALVELAIGGSEDARTQGVPKERRGPAHAAFFWLRAWTLDRKAGNQAGTDEYLERARGHAPEDPAVTAAALFAADDAGDAGRAAALARGELARGVHGPLAAALQMRITEAAAAEGDATTAVAALREALKEDPRCIPAWALLLHLLAGGDPTELAEALERAATDLESPELGAELLLLSADTRARVSGDVAGAKAALFRAAAGIATPEVRARVARALAALLGDSAWFEEATRELLATDLTEGERASLWFELARGARSRGDRALAVETLTELGKVPSGAWLGDALLAYALPGPANGGDGSSRSPSAEALERLAAASGDPVRERAFRLAAASRYAREGQVDDGLRVLSDQAGSDPADLVSALALFQLAIKNGEREKAETALTRAADAVDDASVSVALTLEAGIAKWTRGERDGAIGLFETASDKNEKAASVLLAWALRAASPNDPAARRRALDAAKDAEDPALIALERFGLEVASGSDASVLSESLAGVPGEGPLEAALWMARALLPGASETERSEAEQWLGERGPGAKAVAVASAHFAAADSAEPPRALETATAWAEADPALLSALETFVRALGAQDLKSEIRAREMIGERLGGAEGGTLVASARLLQRISDSSSDAKPMAGKDPVAVLTNLELSPPGSDPHRRAAALTAGTAMFDPVSAAAALSLVGWNLLATGDARGAITAFRSYLEHHAEDIVGWEGLRAASELCGDKALLAEASAALGDLSSDAGQGAELWERAALVLLDDLNDAAHGEAALARAVERDIGRPVAFDRLFRIVRARKDGARLLELIAQRLPVTEDPEELAKLYWERARVMRERGDSSGALEALENVTMLEPDHVGALALTGEIYIGEKRFDDAAESLARLSRLAEAPAQQRLMSGSAAADLYEGRLGSSDRAIAVLMDMYRAGLTTLPVRERIARSALKGEAWDVAAEILEVLMTERESREARIEAARTALGIRRDRLGTPKAAQVAASRLLEEAPDDGEALDLALAGHVDPPVAVSFLTRGRTATQATLMAQPMDLERMIRLSEIAKRLDDVQLRQVTLGGIVALGGQRKDRIDELALLDARIARVPQIAVDESVIAGLRDAEDRGALADLVSALATTFAEALGPGLAALGVTKKERVRPQDGLPLRNEIAAWNGALGLGEFDLYVGGRDPNGICAVATEQPAIVVGAEVKAPLSAHHRQALARELLALRLGTTILRHRDPSDIAALVVAACNLSDVKIESPPYAMLPEFERQLGKEMPRRVRKALPEIATRVAREKPSTENWVRAANSTLDRLAAVAVGDVSWVLAAAVGIKRGDPLVTTEGKLRAARLLSFVLSPTFFAVREKLGMGVR